MPQKGSYRRGDFESFLNEAALSESAESRRRERIRRRTEYMYKLRLREGNVPGMPTQTPSAGASLSQSAGAADWRSAAAGLAVEHTQRPPRTEREESEALSFMRRALLRQDEAERMEQEDDEGAILCSGQRGVTPQTPSGHPVHRTPVTLRPATSSVSEAGDVRAGVGADTVARESTPPGGGVLQRQRQRLLLRQQQQKQQKQQRIVDGKEACPSGDRTSSFGEGMSISLTSTCMEREADGVGSIRGASTEGRSSPAYSGRSRGGAHAESSEGAADIGDQADEGVKVIDEDQITILDEDDFIVDPELSALREGRLQRLRAKMQEEAAVAPPLTEERRRTLVSLTGNWKNLESTVTLLICGLGMSFTDVQNLARTRPELLKYSTETLIAKVVTLTCFGFDETDVRKLVVKAPRILEQKLASTLKAKLELLSTVGLNAKQVAKLMISCPMLFQLSVEKTLVPRMKFLEREFGPVDMKKIVSRYPSTLTMKVESRLSAVLGVLCGELGIPEETVRRKVVINPQILALSRKRLLKNVAWLEGIGMERREVAACISNRTQLLWLSVEENLGPKFDYLVNEMEGDIGYVIKFPNYFTFSLEERIIPRFTLYRDRHKSLMREAGGERVQSSSSSSSPISRERGGVPAPARRLGPPASPWFNWSTETFCEKAGISLDEYAAHCERSKQRLSLNLPVPAAAAGAEQ